MCLFICANSSASMVLWLACPLNEIYTRMHAPAWLHVKARHGARLFAQQVRAASCFIGSLGKFCCCTVHVLCMGGCDGQSSSQAARATAIAGFLLRIHDELRVRPSLLYHDFLAFFISVRISANWRQSTSASASSPPELCRNMYLLLPPVICTESVCSIFSPSHLW